LIWIIAGVIALVIALSFAQCAALLPRVGGPYAYAKEAWGPFAGFIVGWSLWLAEWMSLAVFPVAFTQYLMFFLPNLELIYQVVVKGLFVAFLITSNIIGVKAAGRTNDILTLIKLTPLILFSIVGLLHIILNSSAALLNFSPFFPYGMENFGLTLVLIFWAYAGFEISSIPADEIKDPSRTIPKAIILGMSIVTIFYLATNIVLFGVRPYTQLASDTAPLASATATMLNGNVVLALIAGLIVGGGALISVAGSDESGMIGTSRLGYALASDGLFPSIFARIHPKYKTPYIGIAVQALTALIASLIGNLSMLVAASVFFMAIAYAATCASIFFLRKKGIKPKFNLKGGLIIPSLGIIFSLYLITQCTSIQITIGLALLLVGIPIYVKYSPKKEIAELKKELLSRDSVLERIYHEEEKFLAHLILHIKMAYRRIAGKRQTWD
jgi:amino acid transporter